MPWDAAREVTFECEPGTLQQHKLETLREHGRHAAEPRRRELQAGDPPVQRPGAPRRGNLPGLRLGPRARLPADQHRPDRRHGRRGLGQLEATASRKTIELAPDSVTIYQMELPYNTVFSKELKVIGNDEPTLAVADWPTKRAWVEYAFDELVKAGYAVSSATTVVKDKAKTQFVYRDALWRGADMFGTGVASFGHVNGVHIQNVDTWEQYIEKLNKGELPLGRAFPTTSATASSAKSCCC